MHLSSLISQWEAKDMKRHTSIDFYYGNRIGTTSPFRCKNNKLDERK